MMKSTQKKLKTKHFRYLSKEYVKHPDRFLKEIVKQWGVNWSNNFNYLVCSSVYPPMRTNTAFEYGFMHQHLGQMIEIAYVILKKSALKPIPGDRLFQYSCNEMFEAEIEESKIFPEKALRTFFGFKNLKDWLAVLDDLLRRRDYGVDNMEENPLDMEYIPIRELLVKLPQILQEIHDRGGVQEC